MQPRRNRGFSLVELSIVLVILGLLVGGVLSGKSLIQAAQLRALTKQYETYRSVTHIFREKYFYLPGDLPNATQFWGETVSVPGCTTDSTTRNGDGDGNIELDSGPEFGSYWVHLSNAKLIEGKFNGANTDVDCGPNDAPRGKKGNGIWAIYYMGTRTSSIAAFNGEYNNTLIYPSLYSNTTQKMSLNPQDVFNIDSKMDDGKPAIGKVRFYTINSAANYAKCTDVDSAASTAVKAATLTASYLVSSSELACGVAFPQF